MKNSLRICLASIAAIVIHPLVLAVITPGSIDFFRHQEADGIASALLMVVIVATLVVLVLGLPSFFLLRKFHRDSWASLAIAGFLAGALPIILCWVFFMSTECTPHLAFGAAARGTVCDWATYIPIAAYFGFHGLIAALAFYAVWRMTRPNNSPGTEI
jgi:hypothetical protein